MAETKLTAGLTVDQLHEQLSRIRSDGNGSARVFTLTRDDYDRYQDDIDTVAFDIASGLVFVTQADVFEAMLEDRAAALTQPETPDHG